MAHAKFSPSASIQWMTCPGSVHLEPDFKDEGSSEYAAMGTAMHELSEKCLRSGSNPADHIGKKFNGYIVNEDMVKTSTVYVEFVRNLPGFKVYEAKVSLEEVIPNCWGTADNIAMLPGKLTVTDLKTGAGNRVDAQGNTQLLCYALGAFLKYDALYDFETITVVIVQPPLENIDTWTVTRQELLEFADRLREAYRRIVEEPTTYVISEKGCKWCRSKSQCPEQRRLASEAAATDFSNLDVDSLAMYLDMIPHLKGFIEAVEAKAKDRILAGGAVEGWKVVEGRRSRSWKNPEATEQFLTEAGYKELIYSKPALLSVAQVEKNLKGQAIDISEFVEVKNGQPTLAKEKDGRAGINKAQSAANDFANA